jgi:DNA helicase-2/ATP-dependent DNA helicase PcrA
LRSELSKSRTVPLAGAPDEVSAVYVHGASDEIKAWERRVPPQMISEIFEILRDLDGTVLILTRHTAHAKALVTGLQRLRIAMYEGAEPKDAYGILDTALKHEGNPKRLIAATVGILQKTCVGLTAARKGVIQQICGKDSIDVRRKRSYRELASQLAPIYESPNIWGMCSAIALIRRQPPEWLKVRYPETLVLLSRLDGRSGGDPLEVLDNVVYVRRRTSRIPRRCIMNVHMAKGREADHVVLVHCSATCFPDSDEGRKVLYVALSRARKSVTVLLPETGHTNILVR